MMTRAGKPCVAQDNPRMNNLETDEGTKQLVASEASAGAKGGGDDSTV
jgi:hypothetical protein